MTRFQTFFVWAFKIVIDSWKFIVIAIHLMRWLTTFYDFRFKWTATSGIGLHPTKAWLSQLLNLKIAIWHFRRTLCNWDERGRDEGHWHANTRGLLWVLPEGFATVQQMHCIAQYKIFLLEFPYSNIIYVLSFSTRVEIWKSVTGYWYNFSFRIKYFTIFQRNISFYKVLINV